MVRSTRKPLCRRQDGSTWSGNNEHATSGMAVQRTGRKRYGSHSLHRSKSWGYVLDTRTSLPNRRGFPAAAPSQSHCRTSSWSLGSPAVACPSAGCTSHAQSRTLQGRSGRRRTPTVGTEFLRRENRIEQTCQYSFGAPIIFVDPSISHHPSLPGPFHPHLMQGPFVGRTRAEVDSDWPKLPRAHQYPQHVHTRKIIDPSIHSSILGGPIHHHIYFFGGGAQYNMYVPPTCQNIKYRSTNPPTQPTSHAAANVIHSPVIYFSKCGI